MPLARYVAEHEHDLAFPFRRYQIQRVYRGERAQNGRFREFYQCDIDVIGKDSLSVAYDAEMPAVIYHVFRELNVGGFTINFNNRKLLAGLFEDFARRGERRKLALREIDKLDKIGRDKVIDSLTGGEIAPTAASPSACSRHRPDRRNAEISPPSSGMRQRAIRQGLRAERRAGRARRSRSRTVRADQPRHRRGLDYYTGTYETFLNDLPGIGGVCSGGRYDNLASHYTKSKLPGVGISIGATRLFYQLKEAGVIKSDGSTSAVLVTQIDAALATDYFAIAADLAPGG